MNKQWQRISQSVSETLNQPNQDKWGPLGLVLQYLNEWVSEDSFRGGDWKILKDIAVSYVNVQARKYQKKGTTGVRT